MIDHTKLDNIKGLYTIVTGKMTLAFHCSRDVASMILGSEVKLNIERTKKPAPDTKMLVMEPWSDLSKK